MDVSEAPPPPPPPVATVAELVPAACLVDADVEVDFAPSVEAEAAEAKAKAQATARAQEAMSAMNAERAAAQAAAEAEAEEASRAAEAAAMAQGAASAERHSMALASLASLNDDTASSGDGERVSCVAKLPDGSRVAFSLRGSAPVAALWWSIEAQSQGDVAGVPPGRDYALVTSYPRRRLVRPAEGVGQTLSEAGLKGPQEAFFLEL